MKETKNSFIMYADVIEYTQDLSDEQMGQLYRAQLQYANGIEPEIADPEVRGIWRVFRHRMAANAKAYADTCAERSKAGSMGGRPKKADAYEEKQKKQLDFEEAKKADTDTDNDTDIKEKPSNEGKKKSSAFRRPTLDEVRAYCLERGNNVDPQRFVDFYEAKGWKVGSQPMKDWKACVRTWEQRNRGDPPKNAGITRGTDFDAIIRRRL